MKSWPRTTLLVFVVAVGAYAVADQLPQPQATAPTAPVQTDSPTRSQQNNGEVPSSSGTSTDKRTVSPEGIAYLERLRKNTPFGTAGFDLKGLRAGMGSRKEPTIKDIKLHRIKIGEIPCEWVVAPGADPDVRLLYLHGGGWVSGSGGNYLPLAADISVAAKCVVLLPDYRLAPEHPFRSSDSSYK